MSGILYIFMENSRLCADEAGGTEIENRFISFANYMKIEQDIPLRFVQIYSIVVSDSCLLEIYTVYDLILIDGNSLPVQYRILVYYTNYCQFVV